MIAVRFVTVDGLTFSYGSSQVLHDISFLWAEARLSDCWDRMALVRVRLIKVLTGILPPGGGSVRVAGYFMPPSRLSRPRNAFGYVPEAAALFETSDGAGIPGTYGPPSRSSPKIFFSTRELICS